MNHILFLLLIFLSIHLTLQQDDYDDGDVVVSRRRNCAIQSDEPSNCETCIHKGSECFWCGGKTKRCMNYEWYFPECDLDDVRHKTCWVNLSAVVIVCSILGGILLVILLSCLCYCFCRCRSWQREKAKKKGIKWQQKYDTKMADLQNKQIARSDQRNKELEAYRLKYGIQVKEEPPAYKK